MRVAISKGTDDYDDDDRNANNLRSASVSRQFITIFIGGSDNTQDLDTLYGIEIAINC